MKCRLKTFGIAREILGGSDVLIEMSGHSVADLRHYLANRYPALSGLHSLFIAVNHAYADDQTQLRESDEIALIPPVSGG